MKTGFNPKGVWQPDGRGFSMGVVQPAGRVVHFTGQVAWDEHENIVGPGDVALQTHQCFRNIEKVLAAVGGELDDLLSVTTYFLSHNDLPLIQKVRAGYLQGAHPPVSTSVMVAGLGHRDFLVELAPLAVVPLERFRDPVVQ